jgi:hypothetical protein
LFDRQKLMVSLCQWRSIFHQDPNQLTMDLIGL